MLGTGFNCGATRIRIWYRISIRLGHKASHFVLLIKDDLLQLRRQYEHSLLVPYQYSVVIPRICLIDRYKRRLTMKLEDNMAILQCIQICLQCVHRKRIYQLDPSLQSIQVWPHATVRQERFCLSPIHDNTMDHELFIKIKDYTYKSEWQITQKKLSFFKF